MQEACQPRQNMAKPPFNHYPQHYQRQEKQESMPDKNLFKDAFRIYVGPGRQWSYEDFGHAIGETKRNIENWAYGNTVPSLDRIVLCGQILGPEFLNRILLPLGYTVTAIDSMEATTYHDLLQASAGFSQLCAEALLPNGGTDHRVMRRIRDTVPVIVNKLVSFQGS